MKVLIFIKSRRELSRLIEFFSAKTKEDPDYQEGPVADLLKELRRREKEATSISKSYPS